MHEEQINSAESLRSPLKDARSDHRSKDLWGLPNFFSSSDMPSVLTTT